jgi:YbbR domain-containing protein
MAYHPFRNPGLKLVSVMLAALLWMTVSRDQLVERSVRVPLEFQNVPEGIEIVGDPPGTVDVRIRGASSQVSRIEAGELIAVLDLRGARAGQRLFHLLTDQVRAPFGVTVAQVSPPTVSLAFERSGTKTVPIAPAIEGAPAAGRVMGAVVTEPATVEVIGPESRLRRLTEATTEPISIQDAVRSVKDVVTVGVADSALRLREGRMATVTIEIVSAPIERTIAAVPVRLRNLGQGLRARVVPASVTLTLRGPGDRVSALEAQTLDVFVDLAELRAGVHTVPVKFEAPFEGLGVARVEPATVQVRIQ